jgi:hydrogenase expression/formation protein HypE
LTYYPCILKNLKRNALKMTKTILLDHGSGGVLTHQLIQELFVGHFQNDTLKALTDSALLHLPPGKLAFTTDSYVVKPIIFPGGNIGKLAVCGTVNDLAVSGARPLYLSAGFILEEGLPYETLDRIVVTMAEEAAKAGVYIVTGDTKVVEKGACDQIFINSAGVGILEKPYSHIGTGQHIQAGDKILINGSVADHGMAVLGKRNELDFSTDIRSDCASLNALIAGALDTTSSAETGIHFMRDATRGGLATVLCEAAQQHQVGIRLDEAAIPVRDAVMGLCELLGFDPLYVANEGKVVMVVHPDAAEQILTSLRQHPLGAESAIIGEIVSDHAGKVVLHTSVGGKRIVDMLSGAQLPRIC